MPGRVVGGSAVVAAVVAGMLGTATAAGAVAPVTAAGVTGLGPHAAAAASRPAPKPASRRPAPPPAAPATAFGQRCAPPATFVVREVPWAQQRLVPQRAWELTRGQGVLVAVIDSGVDARVPQLAGHVLPGVDIVNGRGRADSDCLGHGTFVASIIAAQQVRGIGFAGIAPGALVLPVRQTNTGQDGTGSGMAAAIRAATDRGAKVINISAASSIPSSPLEAAVRYAQRHDVLIVAAADNQAKEGDPRSFPASYPGVVAVGAIDQQGKRSEFSETGDFIDLVAPGAGVLGLGTGGPGHLVGDGTSFAAPFVSGAAALVRSYYPRLTADQVARRLELTADHPGVALPDRQLGWGVVNPYAALATQLPAERAAGGPTPVAAPLPLPAPQPVDRAPRDRGLLVAAGGLIALLVIAVLAAVLPRGRRRGWQPARAGDQRAARQGTGRQVAGRQGTGERGTGERGTGDEQAGRADRAGAGVERAGAEGAAVEMAGVEGAGQVGDELIAPPGEQVTSEEPISQPGAGGELAGKAGVAA